MSDHTGVTAEAMAHSLMARFDDLAPHYVTRPFVDEAAKVDALVAEIDATARHGGRPIVCSTLTDPDLRQRLVRADALVLNLFEFFDDALTAELGVEPSTTVGRYHGIQDVATYQVRLDAVDYVLSTDDGLNPDRYAEADVVVVGVSRVGKTPTCLYLALQYGIRAANFPLTGDSIEGRRLPEVLATHRSRLFGLTIDPTRLYQIRQKRRPDSIYASLERCGEEVRAVEALFRAHRIAVLDTTARSIEEITAALIDLVGIERRLD